MNEVGALGTYGTMGTKKQGEKVLRPAFLRTPDLPSFFSPRTPVCACRADIFCRAVKK
jgi:hypothetical protein